MARTSIGILLLLMPLPAGLCIGTDYPNGRIELHERTTSHHAIAIVVRELCARTGTAIQMSLSLSDCARERDQLSDKHSGTLQSTTEQQLNSVAT